VSLLDVDDIHTYYEHSHILQGVSLQAESGRVTALLGRNGVGKTTLIRSVIGFTPPRTGHIRFSGEPIERLPSHTIARRGVGLVPQGRRVFPSLTVEENLRLGGLPGRAGRWSLETVYGMFPGLRERAANYGGQLSGGEQQMVAIGRALMSRPRLLLMDEPSMGLSPALVQQNFQIIKQVNETGVAMLMVEQNANMALSIAHRGYVLATGELVLADTAANLLASEDLKRAYLGH
jgi:branched-chain amino acid transport system ATP-binding protein